MKWRWLLILLAVLFTGSILGVSLMSSVPSAYSFSQQFKNNDKQFYLDEDILPDHVLYPALMVADKVKMKLANDTEQVYLATTYANLRLRAAQELLAKNNPPLALATYSKSQKYLLRAAGAALATTDNPELRQHVLQTMLFHHQESKKVREEFDEEGKQAVVQLDNECQVFVKELSGSL